MVAGELYIFKSTGILINRVKTALSKSTSADVCSAASCGIQKV